ncbi:MAG: AlkA N-terminal domain-containing protein [Actinomycetota bacterium]
MTLPLPDADRCYRAVESRDARFDGWFIVGVTSTGIYCRPSCPTPVRPKRKNTRFFPTAAAAQREGFRACKRCYPDAVPGSPEWDVRGDLAGRAMRLIADGVIDREGVGGLAHRLAVSERHLNRLLNEVVGAGPIALARSQRARTARILIETTTMSFAEIAFAAGFGSIRQFNDTIREVFARTPSELRDASSRSAGADESGALDLRLALRPPFEANEVLGFLAWHGTPGVEELVDGVYRRSLDLRGGPGVVELRPADDHVAARLWLTDLTDLTTAVARCRRLLDLDADPLVVAEVLERDEVLRPLVRRRPGLRVPGAVDGVEHTIRTIVGQQISVTGAATVLGRMSAAVDARLDRPIGGVTHRFPRADELLGLSPDQLPMPTSRAKAVRAVCEAVVDDGLVIDTGADRSEVRQRLLALPGIGPWTVESVAMRALGDPDGFLVGDLVLKKAAEAVGLPAAANELTERSEAWSPFRAYATHHLWAHVLQTNEEAA